MNRLYITTLVLVLLAGAGLAVFFLKMPYSLRHEVETPAPVASALPPVPVDKVKVLLVPGHDLVDVGASFNGTNEETLTRRLAGFLSRYLADDERFEVTTTRDVSTGDYSPQFASFLAASSSAITNFKTSLRTQMRQDLKEGTVQRNEPILHNRTTTRAGNVLYGINLWANEHQEDLTLHIHFNNYPRNAMTKPGVYSGYALYIPERQYDNATSSRAAAQSIEQSLHTGFHPSDLPIEKDTVIESQDLIAVGANNSRNSASVLIEYGYIYEPQIADDATLENMAKLTYDGLVERYFPQTEVKGTTVQVAPVKALPIQLSAVDVLKNSLPKRVKVKVTAKAYIAADLDTGEVLLQSNQSKVLPIASVSKLMTALVATKYMNLSQPTKVSQKALDTEESFGELRFGEQLSIGTLLYPLLMESSNDAAEVIAEAYGRDQFIALMNKEAKSIGAKKTHFDDPTGLSEHNVSTPEDLVRISRYIEENYPKIFTITRQTNYKIKNHIWKNPVHFLSMKTYIGGKNGFTEEAENTAMSLFSLRGKTTSKRIAVALLGSENRDKDMLAIIGQLDIDRGVVQ